MSRPLLLLLALLAGSPAPALAQSQPATAPTPGEAARELLRQAVDLYVVGRYQQAADRLRPLVETRVLRDRADQAEALRAYGISLYLIGGRAGAERAFRDLLRDEPGARLDPAFVRPEVVSFFEQVRRRHQAEQNEMLRRRGPKGTAALNLLPPWGQFQNGHRGKGYTLLGAELTLGLTWIATGALLNNWAGDSREFRGHEGAYRPLFATEIAAFSAFCATVVYGIVDGLYFYYRPPAASPEELRELGASDHSARAWPSPGVFRF